MSEYKEGEEEGQEEGELERMYVSTFSAPIYSLQLFNLLSWVM